MRTEESPQFAEAYRSIPGDVVHSRLVLQQHLHQHIYGVVLVHELEGRVTPTHREHDGTADVASQVVVGVGTGDDRDARDRNAAIGMGYLVLLHQGITFDLVPRG